MLVFWDVLFCFVDNWDVGWFDVDLEKAPGLKARDEWHAKELMV